MRLLVLLSDAFGGRGGIAKFNRDLLEALTSHPAVTEVVALPRRIEEKVAELPAKLDYRVAAAGGKAAYFRAELAVVAGRRFDLVICGHLRLLPLTQLLTWRGSVPLGLVIHGIDAWEPSGGWLTRRALRRLDWFLAVSAVTKTRFTAWSGVAPGRGVIVPNAVDLVAFTPGPRAAELVARYGLAGRRVVMSLGRLEASERYKGFDELLEALPRLRQAHPDLLYLICGDGNDRARLAVKAAALGLAGHVVFAGYIAEAEKADHYRLADCFVLAGSGEGFGIVLLEAMACGIPAVASCLDGSAEAVGEGALGIVVNPREPDSLVAGISEALSRPRRVPSGLERFSAAAFEDRVHRLILDPLAAQKSRVS